MINVLWSLVYEILGFLDGSDGKESAGNAGDLGLSPGLGRFPGGGHDNPLQYSCLENPHGQRNLAGYSLWVPKESDWQRLSTHHTQRNNKYDWPNNDHIKVTEWFKPFFPIKIKKITAELLLNIMECIVWLYTWNIWENQLDNRVVVVVVVVVSH